MGHTPEDRPSLFELGLLGLGFFGAGMLAGGFFFTPPAEIKEVEKVIYRDREVEVIKEVRVADVAVTKVVWRDRTVKPDGTVTEREVEKTDAEAHESTKTDTARERVVEHTKEVTKLVVQRPAWTVTALAGTPVKWPPEPVFGALVQRRLAGPVLVGAWGLYPASLGVALTVEF